VGYHRGYHDRNCPRSITLGAPTRGTTTPHNQENRETLVSTEKTKDPRLAENTGKWIVDTNNVPAIKHYEHRNRRTPRQFVIIGTSGSRDYLEDSTSNQPFWPVYTPTTTPTDDTNTDDDPPCDGSHDTDTSLLFPCTRCFPYGRDTQRNLDEREDNAIQQDEDQDYQEPS
jgi:hypothetical protein